MLALALAALTTIALAPTASAKTKSSCERPGSRTVAENAVARLFTRPSRSPLGYRDLFGCWKKRGRARSLEIPHHPCWLRSDFDLLRLRGRFAALYIDRLDRGPGRPADCGSSRKIVEHFVHVVDLRQLLVRVYEIDGRPAGGRLLLDTRGAIAWPSWLPHNQVAVRVIDSEGTRNPDAGPEELWGRVLDSGAIHPESLELAPGKLSWFNEDHSTSRDALLGWWDSPL